MTHEYEAELRPSIGAAIGLNYALGNLLPRLGDRRAQFEADVREALADADSTPMYVRLVDSALVGRRPTSRAIAGSVTELIMPPRARASHGASPAPP